ncbi:MAG: pitrilysin family protein [Thermoanaerobaculia bacterium]
MSASAVRGLVAALLTASAAAGAWGADFHGAALPVEEMRLDNGLRLLLLPRPGQGTVQAGWIVRAGAADEPPGRTGLAHLVEHMLFKGTRTIAARDPEREMPLLAEEDRLHQEIRELQDEAARLETKEPGGRLERVRRRIVELGDRLTGLVSRLRELTFLGEYSFRYSEAGATGLNANTGQDFTVYYVTLPTETLELWFWLESDRLLDPVFREFHKEQDVIAEERRQRVEATPTGLAEEELARRFWQDGPYGRPTLGWPDEMRDLTRQDVLEFFRNHYVPGRLTLALVGDVDPQRARELATRYFGRLEPQPAPPAPPPIAPAGEGGRWETTCACPTQVRVLYRSPALGETGTPALQLAAALLDGRSGRLYRSLVLDQALAFSAAAQQTPYARAGVFDVSLEAKGGATPEALLAAWDREVEALRDGSIPPEELERARNQLVVGSLRQLREPDELLRRLLIYDALDDWRQLAGWPERILALREDDIHRAVGRYLTPEHRWVAFLRREGEG